MSKTFVFNFPSKLKKLKEKFMYVMGKLVSIIRKVFDLIFPFVACFLDNQTIKQKQSSRNILDDIDNPDAISIDTLKSRYSDAMYQKDKLEDKAKINVVGISIAISLILGASNFLTVVSNKYPCSIFSWVLSYTLFTWIIFILFVFAVSYLLIAGIVAIEVLIKENKVFTIDLKYFAANTADLRQNYGKRISENDFQNLIRNNIIYTSYECIRNALICLFILLVFLAMPYSAL